MRYTYLAPAKPFKGYNLVKNTLDSMWNSGNRNFELNVFDKIDFPSEYMNVTERGYKYEDLKDIFSKTDILLAPSLWYETFGFTILEALSFDVPVIITKFVGSKDIICGCGKILELGNETELKSILENINKDTVIFYKEKIKKEINI